MSTIPSEQSRPTPPPKQLILVLTLAGVATVLWTAGIVAALLSEPSGLPPDHSGPAGSQLPIVLDQLGLLAGGAAIVLEVDRRRGRREGDLAEGVAWLTTEVARLTGQLRARDRAQRETLRRLAAVPRHNGTTLDRSEYWDVYADVMRDLGNLGEDIEPPEG